MSVSYIKWSYPRPRPHCDVHRPAPAPPSSQVLSPNTAPPALAERPTLEGKGGRKGNGWYKFEVCGQDCSQGFHVFGLCFWLGSEPAFVLCLCPLMTDSPNLSNLLFAPAQLTAHPPLHPPHHPEDVAPRQPGQGGVVPVLLTGLHQGSQQLGGISGWTSNKKARQKLNLTFNLV